MKYVKSPLLNFHHRVVILHLEMSEENFEYGAMTMMNIFASLISRLCPDLYMILHGMLIQNDLLLSEREIKPMQIVFVPKLFNGILVSLVDN